MLGLVLAELGLRVTGISYPLPYVPDAYCGSRLRPGMTALFSAEGRAVVTINQDGFRDRFHARQKPSGTLRIAVLGDSFAEAVQVPLEETFWSIVQDELQQCPSLQSQQVEVMNFGISGFGTAQELEMLRHHVWDYDPDVVLLAFCSGNDVSDNSKQLSPDGVRPYYTLGSNGLVLDQSFRQHPFYLDAQTTFSRFKVACINRLRLLQVVREARARSLSRGRNAARQPGPEAGLDPVFRPPSDAAWREAWEITEQLLVRIQSEAADHGAEFMVVTVSNGIQVHPDADVRAQIMRRLSVSDLFYADRRIEEVGRRHDFPVIALAPEMQQFAEENKVFLHGFGNTAPGTGHWNTEGHRVAGTIIAREMCRLLF